MDRLVTAKKLSGTIEPPPFKSEVIRCLLFAAMSGVHPTHVVRQYDDRTSILSDDIRAAVSAIGSVFFGPSPYLEPIRVNESATLLRLLAPVLLAKQETAVFSVGRSLFHRDFASLSRCTGCTVKKYDCSTGMNICFSGRLDKEKYIIDASETSQFASGMLLAMLIGRGFALRIDSPVSLPYIKLTLDCIRRFGGCVVSDADGVYSCTANKLVSPREFVFEPDHSYIANFTAANYIMNGTVERLPGSPFVQTALSSACHLQADAVAGRLLFQNDYSISDCPDSFPILSVAALMKPDPTVIRGTARLRGKESDRVRAVAALIRDIGGDIDVFDDHIVIFGCGGELSGGQVFSFGDHRIVMAAAIASLMCRRPVLIGGAEAVSKSAPQFFSDFISLGGEIIE